MDDYKFEKVFEKPDEVFAISSGVYDLRFEIHPDKLRQNLFERFCHLNGLLAGVDNKEIRKEAKADVEYLSGQIDALICAIERINTDDPKRQN